MRSFRHRDVGGRAAPAIAVTELLVVAAQDTDRVVIREGGVRLSAAQNQPMAYTLGASWWALLLRGIAAVLFGLAALAWPGLTLAVLVVFYGAYAVVDGAFAVVAGVRADTGTRRWLLLVEGALGILAGLIALLWPGITARSCSSTSSRSGPSSAG